MARCKACKASHCFGVPNGKDIVCYFRLEAIASRDKEARKAKWQGHNKPFQPEGLNDKGAS